MAAATSAAAPELVPLRNLKPEDLEAVLVEEQLVWRSVLHWDFAASAELVRRFLKIQALSGYAVRIGGQIIGYAYYVCEDRKGLVGDLFLMRGHDTAEHEDQLLAAIIHDLAAIPSVRRIEAQLMMIKGPFERQLPVGAFAHVYPRILMMIDLNGGDELRASAEANTSKHGRDAVRLLPWTDQRQEEAAKVIASAYAGHIDSSINDQYRSYSGAKRFLANIVQYPGCGQFCVEGSLLAEDATGRLCGLVLSSRVAADVGHITQICVVPEWKGKGLGHRLMCGSLLALVDSGCERASLTVTASNTTAIGLYQRMGFRATRRFAAYVWDGF